MKRYFILCFILIYHFANSQIAQPFPDRAASWVITECWGPPPGWSCANYRYFSNGDTSINGMSYMFLKYSINLDPTDTTSSTVVGYYRIDGQKVFYLQDSSYANSSTGMYNSVYFNTGQEILLYDFGIQIGDTFSLSDTTYFLGQAKLVLTQIDTVQISSDPVRRFIFTPENLSNCFSTQNYYWYEGIGSIYGFFPNFFCFENEITFDCFHENNIDYVFYLQPGDDCMNITLGENHPSKVNHISVFPNPTNGQINIVSDFNDDNVVITDMTGKWISSFSFSVGNNLIDIQYLSPGLYFLKTKMGVEKIFISY